GSVIAHFGHRSGLEAVVGLGQLVGGLREIAFEIVVAVLQALGDAEFLTALASGGRLLGADRGNDKKKHRCQAYRTFHCVAPWKINRSSQGLYVKMPDRFQTAGQRLLSRRRADPDRERICRRWLFQLLPSAGHGLANRRRW